MNAEAPKVGPARRPLVKLSDLRDVLVRAIHELQLAKSQESEVELRELVRSLDEVVANASISDGEAALLCMTIPGRLVIPGHGEVRMKATTEGSVYDTVDPRADWSSNRAARRARPLRRKNKARQ